MWVDIFPTASLCKWRRKDLSDWVDNPRSGLLPKCHFPRLTWLVMTGSHNFNEVHSIAKQGWVQKCYYQVWRPSSHTAGYFVQFTACFVTYPGVIIILRNIIRGIILVYRSKIVELTWNRFLKQSIEKKYSMCGLLSPGLAILLVIGHLFWDQLPAPFTTAAKWKDRILLSAVYQWVGSSKHYRVLLCTECSCCNNKFTPFT